MGRTVSSADLHQRLLRDATDTSLPRGVRMEQLGQLSYASCMNIPEMIFGPNDETRAAFDEAKRSLARYPSERALLDLRLDATNRVPDSNISNFAPERFILGAAVIAGTITNNPRIATCTRIAVSYW